MRSCLPIFNSFMQNSYQIVLTGAFHDGKVFDKETVLDIPPAVKNSTSWVQKILYLFFIDFSEGRFYIKLLISVCHLLPHVIYSSGDDSVSFVIFPLFDSEALFVTCHCVGFTATSLSICEDGSTVAIHSGVYEATYVTIFKNLVLSGLSRQDSVETVGSSVGISGLEIYFLHVLSFDIIIYGPSHASLGV